MVTTMVLIADGSSEIGANVRSNLCHLICLRHLIRSRALTYGLFPEILFSFMIAQHVLSYLSNVSNMIRSGPGQIHGRIRNSDKGAFSGFLCFDIFSFIVGCVFWSIKKFALKNNLLTSQLHMSSKHLLSN